MSFLIFATGWGARLVLLILFGLSIWSVAIMLEKFRAMKKLGQDSGVELAKGFIKAKDWAGLGRWAEGKPSLTAGAMQAALEIGKSDSEVSVDRAVKSYLTERRGTLEKGLIVLATLGSNAPFIGLFGTVLGIIQAFAVLSSSPSGTSAIMYSLAEALVATAVGLFVAIPAVVAYNVFSRKLKQALTECEILRDFFVAHAAVERG